MNLKKFSFICSLLLVTNIVIAGTKQVTAALGSDQLRYCFSATYIHNNSPHDVAYEIQGYLRINAIYGVALNGVDEYHAGQGDEYATIKIARCYGGVQKDKCEFAVLLHNCVGGKHYDINLVRDVTINPDMSCAVTCRDGSSNTCERTNPPPSYKK